MKSVEGVWFVECEAGRFPVSADSYLVEKVVEKTENGPRALSEVVNWEMASISSSAS